MSIRLLIAMSAFLGILTGGSVAEAGQRPVILIGIDGFRADYLERG